MTSNVDLLLSPSREDISDASTWRCEAVQTPGIRYVDSDNLLVPRVSEPEARHTSTSTSSTAYEPIHIESEHMKDDPAALSPIPLRATLLLWSLEAGAMILSIGSIVSIIAVLYREDDKPLDRWSLAVSLNTVISTLGTLSRTALAFALSACVGQQKWSWLHKRSDRLVAFERFDEASQGPWGGTRLLIWLRARHWAALGALVIMSTIAFDPFLQAVISLYGRLDDIGQGSNATIGYAKNIHGGLFIRETNQGTIDPNSALKSASFLAITTRPDFGVVGSTYNGLRNPSASLAESTGFTCNTGNCTWPVFSSAAIYSSCVDVSTSLEPKAGFGLYGVSVPWETIQVDNYTDNYTTWSLHDAGIRNYNHLYTPENHKKPQTLLIMNTTTTATSTVVHQELETMIMAFTTIRASEDFLSKRSLWNESRPVATECALFFCVNAYQTVSINNALEERILGTWSQKEPRSYEADYSYYTFPVNETWADKMDVTLGTDLFDANTLHTDLQLVIPPEALNTSSTIDRRFNISQGFIYSTISFLLDFTSKPSRESINTGRPWIGLNNVGYPSTDRAMPVIIDAMWNSTNVTTTFGNIARSMTNQLRNTSPTRHDGVVQQWTIHLRVNWWYLLFPITMLTTGLVYVVLVIIESTRLRIPVWKERTLPTLLYGFNDETQRLLRDEQHGKHPSSTVVRYRIDDKEDCLRLVADRSV